MANAQNITVSFIIRTARMIEGQAPIYARISIDGKRTEFSIKRSILPERWNKEAGKVKPKSKEAGQINAFLDKIRKKLWECYSESLLKTRLLQDSTSKISISELMKMPLKQPTSYLNIII